MDELLKKIRIFCLQNAIEHNGKSNDKAVLGKLLSTDKNLRSQVREIKDKIKKISDEINNLNLDEQKEEFEKLKKDLNLELNNNKKVELKEGLPDLPNVNGKIRVRTEPSPSGRLHLGHIFNIILNYEYKKKYGGEFILRFGDTNPENIEKENYESIKEDINWLTDNGIDEIYYQSERLNIYYKYIRELINLGKAYVCSCSPEDFKRFNEEMKPCPHRNLPVEKNLELFEKMINGEIKPNEAVIKFKANLQDKNPALRDFSIARVLNKEHPHLKEKRYLWPMMNLTVAVDDSLMNLTHVIRGKDHEINMIRQKMIHDILGLKSPEYIHLGRIKFTDLVLSKTKFTEMINEGKFDGWDDPRIPTLASFRKRGYEAEAFRKLVVKNGVSKRDTKVSSEEFFKTLNYFNKQILEKKSNRYFFVYNPKKVIIKNSEKIPFKEIKIEKHPDFPDRGFRVFQKSNELLITGADFENLKEEDLFRLMHYGNFKIIKKNENDLEVEFLSKEYDKNMKIKRNIHFLNPNNVKNAIVVLEDNTKLKGLVEENIKSLKENETVQFERFGFCKLDKKNKDVFLFYFTQK